MSEPMLNITKALAQSLLGRWCKSTGPNGRCMGRRFGCVNLSVPNDCDRHTAKKSYRSTLP